jgi:hypothetical protein
MFLLINNLHSEILIYKTVTGITILILIIEHFTVTTDWRRQTGSTGSTNTGPKSDHTYGTSRGKFHLSWGKFDK